MYSNIDSNKVLLSEFAVRCRTGSLENLLVTSSHHLVVRCRTGSLEMLNANKGKCHTCALPHRQLRNDHPDHPQVTLMCAAAQAA